VVGAFPFEISDEQRKKKATCVCSAPGGRWVNYAIRKPATIVFFLNNFQLLSAGMNTITTLCVTWNDWMDRKRVLMVVIDDE
jgi:hypothetical protein